MTRFRLQSLGLGLAVSTCLASPVSAQGGNSVHVRGGYFAESYSFDPGLSYSNVSEYTWPVGLNASFGSRLSLAVSTGYVIVRLESAVPDQLPDQRLSGIIDSELRLSYDVIPGRLIIFGTGVVPTGIKTVAPEELSILGAISSDLIGFTATTLGTGGQVGGGFAGAMPFGKFALGVSGTYTNPLGYTPVTGDPQQLFPGAELRIRAGIEGPLARRTYLRTAVIFAARQQDQVGASTQNGVGNRIIGYASVNQGLGPGTLTLFVFDVFRGSPILEPGLVGAAILPRGNLVSLGGRYDWSLGLQTTVSPRAEFRLSTAAPPEGNSKLLLAGQSFRYGADIRRQFGRSLTGAVQIDGLTGFVVQAGERIRMNGYRASLHLEWRP
jgi:hypothetical protein